MYARINLAHYYRFSQLKEAKATEKEEKKAKITVALMKMVLETRV